MGRKTRKDPDLTSLSKKLTSQRMECTEEIKQLMECMAVRRWSMGWGWGGPEWGSAVNRRSR